MVTPNQKPKAYILGAGVSGLASGWMLAQNGWEVSVFEKENICGGLASTRKWGEFYLDFGPHIFHTISKDLESLWERELGGLFVKGEFWCKNVKGENFDEYFDYPLSTEAINSYPPHVKEKVLRDLKKVDENKKAKAKNYREYVQAIVGPTLQEMFFEMYPQKIWGISTEEMTANWAPKRIELREKRAPFYTGRWNAVGRFGSGCIMERIADKIKYNGGRVFLGKEAKEIEHSRGTLKAIVFSDESRIELGASDVVISTVPITTLSELLGIDSRLKFRGVISVAIALKRPYILPEGVHFLYYDSPEVIFHRVCEQKKFSDAGFPKDKTFLTAEITYEKNDELDKTNDKVLIEKVLEDLVRVGLVKRSVFQKGLIQKQAFVYPLLNRDYELELGRVQSRIAKYKSLYSVGGPAEYNYADIHINFLKAMDLAKILTDKHSYFYKVKREVTMREKGEVKLNGKSVGNSHKPFIIAEAGLNHNGRLDLALKLVEEAKKAKCDAVKFQIFSASNRVSNKVKKALYAEQIVGLEENTYEMLKRLELSRSDCEKIFDHGQKIGIDVFATPFDIPSIELLESLNTPYYKVASSDLNNLPLLARISKTGKPIILSTGMSTLGEIEDAINCITKEGPSSIILLHCLSSYPADPEEINLNTIKTLKRNFRLPVGLSDHTLGLSVSIAAMAIGANVIERHFTLDRFLEGPDHIFSSEPSELTELTKIAASINTTMGDGIKRIQPSEYDTINSFKKTIYAKDSIKKGSTVTEDMLTVKGPGGGLPPKFLPVVVGREAKQDIEADHPITFDDI